MARLSPAIAARPRAARLVLRSLYVVLTVVAAILLPFIGDLMGIVRPFIVFACHLPAFHWHQVCFSMKPADVLKHGGNARP